MASAVMKSIL